MDRPPETDPRRQALARLLTRIGEHRDFPTLQESITSIQRIVRSENAHMRSLTEGVLSDVALTAKLLRLINAACYRAAGTGKITSVQRALSLLGFQAVGMMAASLLLFEKLPRGTDGARVREDFSRALLAGLLAQELCHSGRDLEHSYLAALFQNLGSMLVSLHFPDEARAIDDETRDSLSALGIDSEGPRAREECDRVTREKLGLTTEDLGIEVATQWGWPEELRDSLRRLSPPPGAAAAPQADYLRTLATAATDLSAQLHREQARQAGSEEESAERRAALIDAFVRRLGSPLSLDTAQATAAVERARLQWQSLAEMLGLDTMPGRRRTHLRLVGPPVEAPAAGKPSDVSAAAPRAGPGDGATPVSDGHEARVPPPPSPAPGAAREDRLGQLERALERASAQVLSKASMAEVASQVLEDLREALSLQRTVLCLRAPGGVLRGRYGSGLGGEAQARRLLASFEVPLGPARDLFSLLCGHARDTLISDASQTSIAERLPAWYRQSFDAPTFVVMPMSTSGQVQGLLYGDRSPAGSLLLDERGLRLLGALRNQLMAAARLREEA